MSAPLQDMRQYRVGDVIPGAGRNFIRVGDRVAVIMATPAKPKAWHLEGLVKAIRGDGTVPVEIDVTVARTTLSGRAQGQPGATRCFTPDRVARLAQTKGGKRRLSA